MFFYLHHYCYTYIDVVEYLQAHKSPLSPCLILSPLVLQNYFELPCLSCYKTLFHCTIPLSLLQPIFSLTSLWSFSGIKWTKMASGITYAFEKLWSPDLNFSFFPTLTTFPLLFFPLFAFRINTNMAVEFECSKAFS